MSPGDGLTSRDGVVGRSGLGRPAQAVAAAILVMPLLDASTTRISAAMRVDADREAIDRSELSSRAAATRSQSPSSAVDDDRLRADLHDVVRSLDEPAEVREALARAIDAELASAPPLAGDKTLRLAEDLARFLASEGWRSPTRDLGGGDEAIALAVSVLRWKLDAVRATPEIDEPTRRAAIAEEVLLLGPALAAAELVASRARLDERATSRLRGAVVAGSDRRVARRGDYFHPELLRPSPEAPIDLLARVEERLAGDPLLGTLVAQLTAETRLLALDDSTRRFREWMQSAQIDAAAARIAAVIEEAWIDSLAAPRPSAVAGREDQAATAPAGAPSPHRPMPEDLASRWTRSRDEAPPTATFDELVRELLAPTEDGAEGPIDRPSGGS